LKVSSNFRRSWTDVCFIGLIIHCSPDSLSVNSRQPHPAALTFDPSGNLYVASPGNGTISKIDSSGNASVFVPGTWFSPYEGVYLAADNVGNIYANNSFSLNEYDSTGNLSTVLVYALYVHGIAVDGAGHIYWAKVNSGGIFGNGSLNTDATHYPAPYDTVGYYGINNDSPWDLTFDANGNLYASGSFLSYGASDGTIISKALIMEFGVDGDNRIIATDITGTYIAVQSVPEPGMCTISVLASVLCLRRWPRR
jgi:hypothetical protein